MCIHAHVHVLKVFVLTVQPHWRNTVGWLAVTLEPAHYYRLTPSPSRSQGIRNLYMFTRLPVGYVLVFIIRTDVSQASICGLDVEVAGSKRSRNEHSGINTCTWWRFSLHLVIEMKCDDWNTYCIHSIPFVRTMGIVSMVVKLSSLEGLYCMYNSTHVNFYIVRCFSLQVLCFQLRSLEGWILQK